MNPKQLAIIFGHAFTGWVFCAATMGIGMATTKRDQRFAEQRAQFRRS